MLPFALVARLDNATVQLVLDDSLAVTVTPGQSFFIPPNRPHIRTILPHGTVTSSWVHVHCTILNTVDLFAYVHPPTILPTEVADRLLDYVKARMRPPATDAKGLCRMIAEYRVRSFSLLESLCACADIDSRTTDLFTHVTRLHPVLEYIQENLAERHTRGSLADRLYLSPSRLDSLFHETLGIGPVAYVIQQRIRHAATQLVRTNHTIQQIARTVGYDNPFYFSRLFKQHTGLTPTAYRKAAFDAHDANMFT
jgi:AraC-like DNA-binding protein